MARIKVTDMGEPVGWFDPKKAYCLEEKTWFDGSNMISEATGSQTEHEKLFLTASGQWVLNRWSQWQGRGETFEAVSQSNAISWLLKNEYEEHELEELPKKKQDELSQALKQYEL